MFVIYSALKAIDHVLQLCEHHLSDGSEAAAHYRNVCRALVSEALELSSFLEKAWLKKNGDDGDFREELQELALRDWVIYLLLVFNSISKIFPKSHEVFFINCSFLCNRPIYGFKQ